MPDETIYTSSRLNFSRLNPEHGQLLFHALADPLVYRHFNCKPPASAQELSEDFAKLAAGPPPHRRCQRWINFAVQRIADCRWIGRVQATAHDSWAEIAYLFGPQFWGQGYASESLDWLHQYLSERCGTTELWATVSPANHRSIALLLRSGYQRCAMAPTRPLDSLEPGDDIYCSLLQ